jgi:hypothetical protein
MVAREREYSPVKRGVGVAGAAPEPDPPRVCRNTSGPGRDRVRRGFGAQTAAVAPSRESGLVELTACLPTSLRRTGAGRRQSSRDFRGISTWRRTVGGANSGSRNRRGCVRLSAACRNRRRLRARPTAPRRASVIGLSWSSATGRRGPKPPAAGCGPRAVTVDRAKGRTSGNSAPGPVCRLRPLRAISRHHGERQGPAIS